jgi:hypothetical protein
MTELTAVRTLVKSPPELWATCSDEESLSQHLEAFGEIRITRLEPETTVAWEGERASGTVRIEPSGWGTKVTMTAEEAPVAAPAMTAEEAPVVAPAMSAEEAPAAVPAISRRGLFSRLFHVHEPEPQPEPQPEPDLSAVPVEPVIEQPEPATDSLAGLETALDSLGQAHHRPFSRD